MAAGISEGTGGQNKSIMTFHPQPNTVEDGGSSNIFTMMSGWRFNHASNGTLPREQYLGSNSGSVQPRAHEAVLDGEPLYEDHPVCFNAKELGISSAYDVRKKEHAYLDLFAGSIRAHLWLS